MLKSSNPTRRIAGRLLVITGIAAALPLTASRAVDYVDVPAPAAPAVSPTVVRAAPLLASAPVSHVQRPTVSAEAQASAAPKPTATLSASTAADAPESRTPPSTFNLATDDGHHLSIIATPVTASTYGVVSADGEHFILNGAAPPSQFEIRGNGETFVIDGKTKRWEELTPGEKAEVRSAVAKANAALAKTHLDQARIMQEVAAIPDRAHLAELQNELARTQANVAESVRRMDERAARDRAAGRDPDQLEAAIRATLQSVQAIDLRVASRALAGVNRDKIAADVANAQASMEAAKAELARIQARIDSEQGK